MNQNPIPLVANLVANAPSLTPSNGNTDNSVDDGSATGVDDAVETPCPCGEGMFTRAHILEKHEKSCLFSYHVGPKQIQGVLFRMKNDLQFRCICNERFALKADVLTHIMDIEQGLHPGHGHSYTSARIAKMS
ncbi:hypothetical protein MSAN_01969500 [Mycena sanguinolenta]|uniref:Uncharacterized protein n=1 Tax=Mycena sanguinolenta TaxID=230812 RepID=A0A8H7CMR9_9AGAR|nr:hypothetical protein MSAN_01969500 [Mycena sanguinolenta]